MTENFLKSRSAKACVASAYKFYADNVERIFREAWFPASISSVLTGLLVLMATVCFHSSASDSQSSPFCSIFLCILALGMVVSYIWADSRMVRLLNGKSRKWNFVRCLMLVGCFLPIVALSTIALGSVVRLATGSFFPNGIVVGLLVAVVCLLFLPFLYVNMRYVMDERAHYWKDLSSSLSSAVRHVGVIFSTVVVSLIFYSIFVVVVGLPLFLLFTAQDASHTGVVIGDPSGMPASFPFLLALTTLVTTFIMTFLSFWFVIVGAFLYGSVASDEQERKQQKINSFQAPLS